MGRLKYWSSVKHKIRKTLPWFSGNFGKVLDRGSSTFVFSTVLGTVSLIKVFWVTNWMVSLGRPQEILNVNYFIKRNHSYFSSKKLWSYLTSFWGPTRICKSFKCHQTGTGFCETIPCFPGWSPRRSQLLGKTSEESGYCPFWGMWWRGKCHSKRWYFKLKIVLLQMFFL